MGVATRNGVSDTSFVAAPGCALLSPVPLLRMCALQTPRKRPRSGSSSSGDVAAAQGDAASSRGSDDDVAFEPDAAEQVSEPEYVQHC
jgi:hypothetical protein